MITPFKGTGGVSSYAGRKDIISVSKCESTLPYRTNVFQIQWRKHTMALTKDRGILICLV